jgi:hypothetical protein
MALTVAGAAGPGSSQGTEEPGTTVVAVSGRAFGAQIELVEETDPVLDAGLLDAVFAGDAAAVADILTAAGIDLDGGDVSAEALVQFAAGPVPEVLLPTEGGGPITDSLASLDLDALDLTLAVAGLLNVSTQGSLGPSGSVTSSASAADVFPNPGLLGTPFSADLIETECSAALDGVSASTTIVDGLDIIDDVPLPAAPEPNTVLIDEVVDIPLGGAILRITVFLVVNEQVVGANNIAVTGARTFATQELILEGEDPLLLSDLEATFAQSECGVVPGVVAPPTFTG